MKPKHHQDGAKPKRPRKPVYLRDEDRFRLLFGPYEPPLVKRGFLVDALRGKVPFGTFTNARIPWPKFKKQEKGGSGGIVLCGDLLRALEKESIPAISYHWGVCHATIGNWKRALELKKGANEGAQRLVRLGMELARLPQSRAKIAAAARGRVMSGRHKSRFHGAMRRGWRTRFKARRAAYRQTGRFPRATQADPWIPEEDKLLSKLTTAELVQVLGRSFKSVQARRLRLAIRARPSRAHRPWQKREIQLLGTAPDREIARRLGRSFSAVEKQRQTLGIPTSTYRS